MVSFPNKKYKIIYADPPWSFNDKLGESRKLSYPVLDTNDLCNLPVENITDKNCVLFMWGSFAMIQDAMRVMIAWGFDYKTMGFIWIKQYSTGSFFKGMGRYTRSNAEPCFVAVKGKPKRIDKGVSQIIQTVTKSHNWLNFRKHSQKPDEVRKKIVKLYGDIPRIELFARTKIHGWDVWGNDEKLQATPLEAFS